MNKTWEIPLDTYLGPGSVIKAGQDEIIEKDGRKHLEAFTTQYRHNQFVDFDRMPNLCDDPDLVLFLSGDRYMVASKSRNTIVAAMTSWFPFTDPEFRGRGLTAEIFRIQDERGHRIRTASYSPSGLMNRVKTHRLHVQGAVDRGDVVPEDVMKDYKVEDGRVSLKEKMDPEAYKMRRDQEANKRELEDFKRKTAHHLITFQDLVKDEGGFEVPEYMGDYRYGGADIHLAIAIKIRHGGQIRVTQMDSTYPLHQVQIDDVIVDAYGIRPIEMADLDARTLLGLREDKDICIDVFDKISDFKKTVSWVENRVKGDMIRERLDSTMAKVSKGLAKVRENRLQGPEIREENSEISV